MKPIDLRVLCEEISDTIDEVKSDMAFTRGRLQSLMDIRQIILSSEATAAETTDDGATPPVDEPEPEMPPKAPRSKTTPGTPKPVRRPEADSPTLKLEAWLSNQVPGIPFGFDAAFSGAGLKCQSGTSTYKTLQSAVGRWVRKGLLKRVGHGQVALAAPWPSAPNADTAEHRYAQFRAQEAAKNSNT